MLNVGNEVNSEIVARYTNQIGFRVVAQDLKTVGFWIGLVYGRPSGLYCRDLLFTTVEQIS
jgi:hypothetical protein